jgi:hypothetical protein
VDFDKNINFEVTPFSQQIPTVNAGPINIDTRSLIEQGFVLRIFGTIEKARYRLEPKPLRIIEKSTGIVTDTIKSGINILEGIF